MPRPAGVAVICGACAALGAAGGAWAAPEAADGAWTSFMRFKEWSGSSQVRSLTPLMAIESVWTSRVPRSPVVP